jgi:23S rRNA (uracil1939-C5)-methyltransferase
LWGKDSLLIDRISQEGRGVATRAGKVVFVGGALPGERVLAQCTAVRRDYDEADAIELAPGTAPSAERVQPGCPVYQQCGGCSLQHWSLAAQQQHKQAGLVAMLRNISPALSADAPVTSPASGFRHRLRLLVARTTGNHYSLGLRQRRSHDAVSLGNCLVANAAVNGLLQALPDILAAAPELQGLREIEIDADSDNRLGLCLYFAAHPGAKVLAGLRTAILAGPVIALRVRLNRPKRARGDEAHGEPDAGDMAGWQELCSAGELCLRHILPGGLKDSAGTELRLSYLPGDFTQTHWQVNAALLARALDWLQPASDDCALDLFSGIGNFSLPLAVRVKTVHALEGDSGMTRRLATNAERNDIDNIVARTVNLMTGELELPPADIAIVDPPRAGAKAVCEALARSKVKRLVYVSCHPATLLRDARILHGAGFSLTRAAAVDMFAHTGHSEAITLFERKSKR